jgi:ribonuclease D
MVCFGPAPAQCYAIGNTKHTVNAIRIRRKKHDLVCGAIVKGGLDSAGCVVLCRCHTSRRKQVCIKKLCIFNGYLSTVYWLRTLTIAHVLNYIGFFFWDRSGTRNIMDSSHPAKTDSPQPASKPQGRINRYITGESELTAYLEDLRVRKVDAVALDMEGDQGNVGYAYSISIIQCFDGEKTIVIDVLKMGNNPALRGFLTDPAIVKIMFSCANDVFMAQNVLGCTIAPMRDIAVGQKLLNLPVNLSDHLNIDKKLKDRFQRANWLKRPIAPELLDYAIDDVVDLFSIERWIAERLRTKGLFDDYLKGSAALVEKNYIIDQMQHYKAKFPGYKRLRPPQRRAAAAVWVFRELLGKHFNCPVGYIMSKQAMASCIADPERMEHSIERELNRNRSSKKQVPPAFIEKYFREAMKISGK